MSDAVQTFNKGAGKASSGPNLGLSSQNVILPEITVIQDSSAHSQASEITDLATDSEQGLYMTTLSKLPSTALLDERALAECLSVSTRTLRRMVGRGEMFQGVKLGGRRMWVAGKVEEFLANATDKMINATKLLVSRHKGIGA